MTDMGRVAAVVGRRANGGFRDSKILPRMAEMGSEADLAPIHQKLIPTPFTLRHTPPIPANTRPRRRVGRGDRGMGALVQWGWKLGSRTCNNGAA